MRNKYVGVLLITLCFPVMAQIANPLLQKRLEYWIERNKVENTDLAQLQELWEYYLENPLNLNTVQKEELSSIDLFSDVQMQDLLAHRSTFGPFLTIYELQTLPSWDTSFIQVILPFVTIEERLDVPPLTFHELTKKGKMEVISRFQHPIDKTWNSANNNSIPQNSNYIGNNDYYLTRIRYTYQQRVSLGITAEKDVGEPFFKLGNKNGFDFYSTHLQVKVGNVIKNIVLGDYHVQIGQGLNCWTSFAIGKSLELTTSKKNPQVIRPHTSTEENRFLRGGAMDLKFNKVSCLFFVSSNRKDASLSSDSTSQITSVLASGYHRTESEFERKDKLKERVFGTYVQYDKGGLHFGLASVFMQYFPGINSKLTPYNQFDFRGKQYQSSSVDYSFTYRNLLVFGELSTLNFKDKTAYLQGVILALDAKNSLSMLYRNYDKGYETAYNAGFSEGNTVQNEKGLYTSFNSSFSKYWSLQVYADFFQFPWLKYQVSLPSKGYDNCIQITYKPTKTFEFYTRYTDQTKEQNSSQPVEGLKILTPVHAKSVRLHLAYKLNDFVEIRARVEGVSIARVDKNKEKGILLYQDMHFTTKNKNRDYFLRFVLFDTDSYASRIYSYESGPAYQFSSPAYYGKGIRAYILVRLTLWKRLDCWFKFGNTHFFTNNTSVVNQLIEMQKKEINLQLRWKI